MTLIATGITIDDRYVLLEELGAGGMGTVFKARELNLERIVAVKFLHPTLIGDTGNMERFRREGKILSTLSHPNILQLFRCGLWQAEYPYLAMEYLQGTSLRIFLENDPPDVQLVLKISIQICSAMQAAHNAGIIHRDLTPSNILLIDKMDHLVKIIDFGLSRLTESGTATVTETGSVIGSLHYMSPEQCEGKKIDRRADLYALGCIMYQMLTGRPPFDGKNPIHIMRLHTGESPVPLPTELKSGESLPVGLQEIISCLLAKEPDDRYESMLELQQDLQLVKDGCGHLVSCTGLHRRAASRATHKLNRVSAAIILSVIATVSVTLLSIKHFGPTRTGAHHEFDGDSEAAAFRRLRPREVLQERSKEQRIQYYQTWLKQYGEKETADAAEACYLLAREYKNGDDVLARKFAKQSLSIAKTIFERCIQNQDGDGTQRAAAIIVSTRTDFEQRDLLRQDLNVMIERLKGTGEAGLGRAINDCRRALIKLCLPEQDYKTALMHLDATLDSGKRLFLNGTSWFDLLVERSLCLWKLDRKAEARKQLQEAFEYGNKAFPDVLEGKLNLLSTAYTEEDYSLCLKAANTFRHLAYQRNKPGDRQALCEIEANALDQLGNHLGAFNCINDQLDLWQNASDRLIMLHRLARIDINGKLHKEARIATVLRQLIADLPNPASTEQLHSIVGPVQQIAELYANSGSIEAAKVILLCEVDVMQKWRPEDSDRTLINPLFGIAMTMRRSKMYAPSVVLLTDLIRRSNRRTDLLDDYYVQMHTQLTASYSAMKQFDKALAVTKELRSRIKDEPAYAKLLIAQCFLEGGVYRELGRFDESFVAFNKAVEFAERYHIHRMRVEGLLSVASLETILGHYSKAEARLKQLEAESELDDDWTQIHSSICSARLYIAMNQRTNALHYIGKLLRKSRQCSLDLHEAGVNTAMQLLHQQKDTSRDVELKAELAAIAKRTR